MKIEHGYYIKIICSNGVIESGKVIEFNKEQAVLKLIDNSLFIILNPYTNIVAIKLSNQEIESRDYSDEVYVDVDLEPDPEDPEDLHEKENFSFNKEHLRAKKLAELYKLKANEERARAANMLRSKKLKETQEVQFGIPNFSKSVFKHPKKKVR